MSGAAAEFLRPAATAGTAEVEKVAPSGKPASASSDCHASARYCTCASSGCDVLASAGFTRGSARTCRADNPDHTGARRTAGPAGDDCTRNHGARLMARPA
jgi:hypothetical protein